jgi:hypothetical protein
VELGRIWVEYNVHQHSSETGAFGWYIMGWFRSAFGSEKVEEWKVTFSIRFWNRLFLSKSKSTHGKKKTHSLPNLHPTSDDPPSPMATPLALPCHAKIRGNRRSTA